MSPETRTRVDEEIPLTGRCVPGLAVESYEGLKVVRWGSHFIEVDYHQVVESEVLTDNPRIGIVRAFHIPDGIDSRSASLDDVRVEGNPPMLFLFSALINRDLDGTDAVIITSRMGGGVIEGEEEGVGEGTVVVRPPRYGPMGDEYTGPIRHVEMFDAPDDATEEELIELHKRRLRYSGFKGRLSFLEPADVDELFLYMSRD